MCSFAKSLRQSSRPSCACHADSTPPMPSVIKPSAIEDRRRLRPFAVARRRRVHRVRRGVCLLPDLLARRQVARRRHFLFPDASEHVDAAGGDDRRGVPFADGLTFHTCVGRAGQAAGAVKSAVAPVRAGPRHCGQSAVAPQRPGRETNRQSDRQSGWVCGVRSGLTPASAAHSTVAGRATPRGCSRGLTHATPFSAPAGCCRAGRRAWRRSTRRCRRRRRRRAGTTRPAPGSEPPRPSHAGAIAIAALPTPAATPASRKAASARIIADTLRAS